MELGRFVEAQDRIWPVPLTEIRSGRKVTHWSWFVMPQVRGLGRSHLAHHYAIQGLDHARAYLAHAVLGPRLIETCGAMLALGDTTAERVLGGIDALKLQSCATLFEAAGGAAVFADVLARYYGGQRCAATLEYLAGHRVIPADEDCHFRDFMHRNKED